MRLLSSLICDYANTTNDGRVNLLGIGGNLFKNSSKISKENPIVLSFVLFLRFERNPIEPQKNKVRVLVQGPNGEKLFNEETEANVPEKFLNFVAPLKAKIQEGGQYSIEIFLNGENISSLSFDVFS